VTARRPSLAGPKAVR